MSPTEGHLWFDLNLAVMDDEALVVLAQECEFGPARDELIIRYGNQSARMIHWLAYTQGHSHADAEDARQNAVFWIIEAINKYDTNQIGKVQGCSFRSFVHRVVTARFKDFAKHLRRVEGHYDRNTRCSGDDFAAFVAELERMPKDPATIAESHESMNRLQETLTNLDGDSLHLWKLLAAGNSLREIAAQLGISYDAAKRRRRKLIAQLRIRLNPSAESANLGVDAGVELG